MKGQVEGTGKGAGDLLVFENTGPLDFSSPFTRALSRA